MGPWISVQVELVEGRGQHLWPRPGRLIAASVYHSFGDLAGAIDHGFARWDRAHLHEFELGDGTRIGSADPEFDFDDAVLDERRLNLSRLKLGEQFIYVFDLGDDWAHLCTVGKSQIDPVETFGIVPNGPLAYFGWGSIPDQYGRGWSGHDGETEPPAALNSQTYRRSAPAGGQAAAARRQPAHLPDRSMIDLPRISRWFALWKPRPTT